MKTYKKPETKLFHLQHRTHLLAASQVTSVSNNDGISFYNDGVADTEEDR